MAFLPHIPQFSVSEDIKTSGIRWKKWVSNFDNIMIGHDITVPKRKRALLLSSVGEEVRDIFDGLTDTGTADDYDKAVEKLNLYFVPKTNPEYEVLVFRREKQEEGETIDMYHARLRRMAAFCNFENVDKQIKLQIMETCRSSVLRTKALMNPDWTLEKLLETARMISLVADQTKKIEQQDAEREMDAKIEKNTDKSGVNAITKQSQNNHKYETRSKSTVENKHKKEFKQTCHFCGKAYPHNGGNRNCPARNATCFNCSKVGHYGRCCRSQRRTEVIENKQKKKDESKNWNKRPNSVGAVEYSSDLDDSVFTMNSKSKNRLCVPINMNNITIEFLVDTGAAVNVIHQDLFFKLDPKPELKKSHQPIYGFASEKPLEVLGIFSTDIEYRSVKTTAIFHVVSSSKRHIFPLLSYETSMQLNIITVNSVREETAENWKEKYPEVFSGIGKLKNFQVKLHIAENAQPISQKARRIPYHLRQAVDKEIDNLMKQDVIEEVKGPTPWVTPVVIVPKPGTDDVRLCLDMRIPNKSIERERYEMPTLEDVTTKILKAKIFSKLDLAKGYHQVELEPESRIITVFSTHRGLYQYKRLFFGINCAPEIFQRLTSQLVIDIEGAEALQDDLLIFAETKEKHDEILMKVLDRLKEWGLTLNEKKCTFYLDKVRFYGEVLTQYGIGPDPEKVTAIRNASNPVDVKDLRSFLGTTGYLMKFVPNYATIVEPLRQLVKKGTKWEWGEKQEQAVIQLKQEIARATTLKYFNPNLETRVWVDASPVGLGAILLQREDNEENFHAVRFASRSLTKVERRYAQVEKEALAVAWSCKRFHLHLVGKSFEVVTDHRPLEKIFNDKKLKSSVRIERMLLSLQEYDFIVKYYPGNQNIADYLSRHPVETIGDTVSQDVELYAIAYVTDKIPKAVTLENLKKFISEDKVISLIVESIKTGRNMKIQPDWSHTEKEFFNSIHKIQEDLSVVDGLLMKNQKLIIPIELQSQIISLAHQGHQGLTKTKQLLRSKVWFPKIDSMIGKEIAECAICQTVGQSSKKDPLQMSELPSKPWKNVAIDFCGPLQGGGYALVIIDEYSRYPIIVPVTATSAKATIPQMEKVFGMFGIPKVVKSDNGPPFSGQEFKVFLNKLGIKHRKCTPRWPQANGVVERLMRPVKKVLQVAHVKGTDWKKELEVWLMYYRATPHSTTGKAPFTMMFGREMQVTIPHMNFEETKEEKRKTEQEMQDTDKERKEKMKNYADQKFKNKKNNLKIGMKVLLKRINPRKHQSNFDPRPWTVLKIKGTMVTAERDSNRVTRNASYFKEIASFEKFTTHTKEENDKEECLRWEGFEVPEAENPQEENRNDQLVRRRYDLRRERHRPKRYIEEM